MGYYSLNKQGAVERCIAYVVYAHMRVSHACYLNLNCYIKNYLLYSLYFSKFENLFITWFFFICGRKIIDVVPLKQQISLNFTCGISDQEKVHDFRDIVCTQLCRRCPFHYTESPYNVFSAQPRFSRISVGVHPFPLSLLSPPLFLTRALRLRDSTLQFLDKID